MKSKKGVRANYIAAIFMNNRPANESFEEFSHRVGLPHTTSVTQMNKRKDVTFGLMYRICKIFGYQIIIYNPEPPKGLEKMYIVGEEHAPVTPREEIGRKTHITKDEYTGSVFRVVRKYKGKPKNYKRVK